MSQEIYFKGSKLPFNPCPTTPNCHIDYVDIRVGTDKGLGLIHRTLKSMGARNININRNRLTSEFRVLVFTDDVQVIAEPTDQGCRVWIRSSSRVGEYDLGVNARRVKKFFTKLSRSIDLQGSFSDGV